MCESDEVFRSVITNARVLHDEFVPENIVHRNAELNQLSGVVEPVLYEEPSENVFLVGPTGVGKTCCARYAVDQLRETVFDIHTQYVNCWQDYNQYRVLYRLLDGIGRTIDIHRQSTPRDELYERLRAVERPYVVVLDEVDQLEESGVLYDLYTLPSVSMILITNDEQDLFSMLDDRVYSRFTGSERVRFDPYTEDEIVSILKGRVRSGLANNSTTHEQLARIADATAGDARVAIGTLRTAARRAHRNGLGQLSTEIIDQAIPRARSELRQKTIDQLMTDQQVLFEIIDDYETVAPGTLYEEYERRAEEPKSRRTVRNYLSKMEHYNVIEAEGAKRGRVYHVSETPFGTTNDYHQNQETEEE